LIYNYDNKEHHAALFVGLHAGKELAVLSMIYTSYPSNFVQAGHQIFQLFIEFGQEQKPYCVDRHDAMRRNRSFFSISCAAKLGCE
jgi:hypothetical protein